MLRRMSSVGDDTARSDRDWVSGPRARMAAWWLPQAAIVAGLLVPVLPRAVIWTIALAWMGVACLLNAARCGRRHCRYTGPYYLAAILPVLALAFGLVSLGTFGWAVLAVLILAGGKVIWWSTERAWGKFL